MTPRQQGRGQRDRRPRRFRRGRRWPAVALAAGLLGTGMAAAGAEPTTAFWKDPEIGTPTLKAGTVSPVRTLGCSAGLLANVKFTWSLPVAGLPRSGYKWTVIPNGTLGPRGSGEIQSPSATQVTLPSGILALGTGKFTLYALEPGGWTSIGVQGTVSVFGLGVPVSTTCSVP